MKWVPIVASFFALTGAAAAQDLSQEAGRVRVDKINRALAQDLQRGLPYDQSMCVGEKLDDIRRFELENRSWLRWESGWVQVTFPAAGKTVTLRCFVEGFQVFNGKGKPYGPMVPYN